MEEGWFCASANGASISAAPVIISKCIVFIVRLFPFSDVSRPWYADRSGCSASQELRLQTILAAEKSPFKKNRRCISILCGRILRANSTAIPPTAQTTCARGFRQARPCGFTVENSPAKLRLQESRFDFALRALWVARMLRISGSPCIHALSIVRRLKRHFWPSRTSSQS